MLKHNLRVLAVSWSVDELLEDSVSQPILKSGREEPDQVCTAAQAVNGTIIKYGGGTQLSKPIDAIGQPLTPFVVIPV